MARKAQKKNKGSKNTNNKTKILCYLIYIYFTNIWQTYLHNWTLYSTIHLTVISSSIDTWYALIYTTFSYQELPLKIDWNLQDSNMLRSLSNVYCFLDNWHHVSYNFISRICFSFPFNKNNIQPLLSLMFTVVFTLKCPFFKYAIPHIVVNPSLITCEGRVIGDLSAVSHRRCPPCDEFVLLYKMYQI